MSPAKTDRQDPVAALLGAFEALRAEYERFFSGLDRAEPADNRQKFRRALQKLIDRPPQNTAQAFRFNTLKARVLTYENLWDRTLRAREDGRAPARLEDVQKGLGHKPTTPMADAETLPPKDAQSAPVAAARLEALYARYLEAAQPRQTGPEARDVPMDAAAFAELVQRQTVSIRAKTGWAKVGLRVELDQGRPVLKAFKDG